ncbi:MAG: hypothetical protein ACHQNV_05440 [Vicinamibacteria bacterium]
MRPLALHLMRRVALYALVVAFLLVAVPWVLTELGVVGPTPEEHLAAAGRALDAARAYGATPEQAAFRAGLEALARGRQLAAGRKGREARRAADEARDLGIEAQRIALATREEARRHAKRIVDAADGRLNELEDLYSEVTVGKTKQEVAPLLSLMKGARQAGAGLFLAFEQDDYGRVIAGEKAAMGVLDEAQAALKGTHKKP